MLTNRLPEVPSDLICPMILYPSCLHNADESLVCSIEYPGYYAPFVCSMPFSVQHRELLVILLPEDKLEILIVLFDFFLYIFRLICNRVEH